MVSVQKADSTNLTNMLLVDYKTFLTILNRPDGFKPAGTPGWFNSY
jgi:hypothetical protein